MAEGGERKVNWADVEETDDDARDRISVGEEVWIEDWKEVKGRKIRKGERSLDTMSESGTVTDLLKPQSENVSQRNIDMDIERSRVEKEKFLRKGKIVNEKMIEIWRELKKTFDFGSLDRHLNGLQIVWKVREDFGHNVIQFKLHDGSNPGSRDSFVRKNGDLPLRIEFDDDLSDEISQKIKPETFLTNSLVPAPFMALYGLLSNDMREYLKHILVLGLMMIKSCLGEGVRPRATIWGKSSELGTLTTLLSSSAGWTVTTSMSELLSSVLERHVPRVFWESGHTGEMFRDALGYLMYPDTNVLVNKSFCSSVASRMLTHLELNWDEEVRIFRHEICKKAYETIEEDLKLNNGTTDRDMFWARTMTNIEQNYNQRFYTKTNDLYTFKRNVDIEGENSDLNEALAYTAKLVTKAETFSGKKLISIYDKVANMLGLEMKTDKTSSSGTEGSLEGNVGSESSWRSSTGRGGERPEEVELRLMILINNRLQQILRSPSTNDQEVANYWSSGTVLLKNNLRTLKSSVVGKDVSEILQRLENTLVRVIGEIKLIDPNSNKMYRHMGLKSLEQLLSSVLSYCQKLTRVDFESVWNLTLRLKGIIAEAFGVSTEGCTWVPESAKPNAGEIIADNGLDSTPYRYAPGMLSQVPDGYKLRVDGDETVLTIVEASWVHDWQSKSENDMKKWIKFRDYAKKSDFRVNIVVISLTNDIQSWEQRGVVPQFMRQLIHTIPTIIRDLRTVDKTMSSQLITELEVLKRRKLDYFRKVHYSSTIGMDWSETLETVAERLPTKCRRAFKSFIKTENQHVGFRDAELTERQEWLNTNFDRILSDMVKSNVEELPDKVSDISISTLLSSWEMENAEMGVYKTNIDTYCGLPFWIDERVDNEIISVFGEKLKLDTLNRELIVVTTQGRKAVLGKDINRLIKTISIVESVFKGRCYFCNKRGRLSLCSKGNTDDINTLIVRAAESSVLKFGRSSFKLYCNWLVKGLSGDSKKVQKLRERYGAEEELEHDYEADEITENRVSEILQREMFELMEELENENSTIPENTNENEENNIKGKKSEEKLESILEDDEETNMGDKLGTIPGFGKHLKFPKVQPKEKDNLNIFERINDNLSKTVLNLKDSRQVRCKILNTLLEELRKLLKMKDIVLRDYVVDDFPLQKIEKVQLERNILFTDIVNQVSPMWSLDKEERMKRLSDWAKEKLSNKEDKESLAKRLKDKRGGYFTPSDQEILSYKDFIRVLEEEDVELSYRKLPETIISNELLNHLREESSDTEAESIDYLMSVVRDCKKIKGFWYAVLAHEVGRAFLDAVSDTNQEGKITIKPLKSFNSSLIMFLARGVKQNDVVAKCILMNTSGETTPVRTSSKGEVFGLNSKLSYTFLMTSSIANQWMHSMSASLSYLLITLQDERIERGTVVYKTFVSETWGLLNMYSLRNNRNMDILEQNTRYLYMALTGKFFWAKHLGKKMAVPIRSTSDWVFMEKIKSVLRLLPKCNAYFNQKLDATFREGSLEALPINRCIPSPFYTVKGYTLGFFINTIYTCHNFNKEPADRYAAQKTVIVKLAKAHKNFKEAIEGDDYKLTLGDPYADVTGSDNYSYSLLESLIRKVMKTKPKTTMFSQDVVNMATKDLFNIDVGLSNTRAWRSRTTIGEGVTKLASTTRIVERVNIKTDLKLARNAMRRLKVIKTVTTTFGDRGKMHQVKEEVARLKESGLFKDESGRDDKELEEITVGVMSKRAVCDKTSLEKFLNEDTSVVNKFNSQEQVLGRITLVKSMNKFLRNLSNNEDKLRFQLSSNLNVADEEVREMSERALVVLSLGAYSKEKKKRQFIKAQGIMSRYVSGYEFNVPQVNLHDTMIRIIDTMSSSDFYQLQMLGVLRGIDSQYFWLPLVLTLAFLKDNEMISKSTTVDDFYYSMISSEGNGNLVYETLNEVLDNLQSDSEANWDKEQLRCSQMLEVWIRRIKWQYLYGVIACTCLFTKSIEEMHSMGPDDLDDISAFSESRNSKGLRYNTEDMMAQSQSSLEIVLHMLELMTVDKHKEEFTLELSTLRLAIVYQQEISEAIKIRTSLSRDDEGINSLKMAQQELSVVALYSNKKSVTKSLALNVSFLKLSPIGKILGKIGGGKRLSMPKYGCKTAPVSMLLADLVLSKAESSNPNETSIQKLGEEANISKDFDFYHVVEKVQLGGGRDIMVQSAGTKFANHVVENVFLGLTKGTLTDTCVVDALSNPKAKDYATGDFISYHKEIKDADIDSYCLYFNNDCEQWANNNIPALNFAGMIHGLSESLEDMYEFCILKAVRTAGKYTAIPKLIWEALINPDWVLGVEPELDYLRENYVNDGYTAIPQFDNMGQGIWHTTSSVLGDIADSFSSKRLVTLAKESGFILKFNVVRGSDDRTCYMQLTRIRKVSGMETKGFREEAEEMSRKLILADVMCLRLFGIRISPKSVYHDTICEFYSNFRMGSTTMSPQYKFVSSQNMVTKVFNLKDLQCYAFSTCQQALYNGCSLVNINLLWLTLQSYYLDLAKVLIHTKKVVKNEITEESARQHARAGASIENKDVNAERKSEEEERRTYDEDKSETEGKVEELLGKIRTKNNEKMNDWLFNIDAEVLSEINDDKRSEQVVKKKVQKNVQLVFRDELIVGRNRIFVNQLYGPMCLGGVVVPTIKNLLGSSLAEVEVLNVAKFLEKEETCDKSQFEKLVESRNLRIESTTSKEVDDMMIKLWERNRGRGVLLLFQLLEEQDVAYYKVFSDRESSYFDLKCRIPLNDEMRKCKLLLRALRQRAESVGIPSNRNTLEFLIRSEMKPVNLRVDIARISKILGSERMVYSLANTSALRAFNLFRMATGAAFVKPLSKLEDAITINCSNWSMTKALQYLNSTDVTESAMKDWNIVLSLIKETGSEATRLITRLNDVGFTNIDSVSTEKMGKSRVDLQKDENLFKTSFPVLLMVMAVGEDTGFTEAELGTSSLAVALTETSSAEKICRNEIFELRNLLNSPILCSKEEMSKCVEKIRVKLRSKFQHSLSVYHLGSSISTSSSTITSIVCRSAIRGKDYTKSAPFDAKEDIKATATISVICEMISLLIRVMQEETVRSLLIALYEKFMFTSESKLTNMKTLLNALLRTTQNHDSNTRRMVLSLMVLFGDHSALQEVENWASGQKPVLELIKVGSTTRYEYRWRGYKLKMHQIGGTCSIIVNSLNTHDLVVCLNSITSRVKGLMEVFNARTPEWFFVPTSGTKDIPSSQRLYIWEKDGILGASIGVNISAENNRLVVVDHNLKLNYAEDLYDIVEKTITMKLDGKGLCLYTTAIFNETAKNYIATTTEKLLGLTDAAAGRSNKGMLGIRLTCLRFMRFLTKPSHTVQANFCNIVWPRMISSAALRLVNKILKERGSNIGLNPERTLNQYKDDTIEEPSNGEVLLNNTALGEFKKSQIKKLTHRELFIEREVKRRIRLKKKSGIKEIDENLEKFEVELWLDEQESDKAKKSLFSSRDEIEDLLALPKEVPNMLTIDDFNGVDISNNEIDYEVRGLIETFRGMTSLTARRDALRVLADAYSCLSFKSSEVTINTYLRQGESGYGLDYDIFEALILNTVEKVSISSDQRFFLNNGALNGFLEKCTIKQAIIDLMFPRTPFQNLVLSKCFEPLSGTNKLESRELKVLNPFLRYSMIKNDMWSKYIDFLPSDNAYSRHKRLTSRRSELLTELSDDDLRLSDRSGSGSDTRSLISSGSDKERELITTNEEEVKPLAEMSEKLKIRALMENIFESMDEQEIAIYINMGYEESEEEIGLGDSDIFKELWSKMNVRYHNQNDIELGEEAPQLTEEQEDKIDSLDKEPSEEEKSLEIITESYNNEMNQSLLIICTLFRGYSKQSVSFPEIGVDLLNVEWDVQFGESGKVVRELSSSQAIRAYNTAGFKVRLQPVFIKLVIDEIRGVRHLNDITRVLPEIGIKFVREKKASSGSGSGASDSLSASEAAQLPKSQRKRATKKIREKGSFKYTYIDRSPDLTFSLIMLMNTLLKK